ncbi:hypothetical protein ABE957_04460 [Halomonas sp. CS7]|uniref:Uncharacterized protein n=1 Tax=Halomonas pelophila TaxID=3151122 RepID=A0ABV1N4A6_9GAMM
MNATLSCADDTNRQQLAMLHTSERAAPLKRDHPLMATLDELNEKMSKGTVRLGDSTRQSARAFDS